MKKRLFAAIALMACLAVSCQKNEDELPTFEARTESGSAKTELVGSIIQWVSGDQVKVFGDFGYAIYNATPRSGEPTWATLTPSENHGLTGLLPYRFVHPASMASGGASNNNTLYVTYPSERSINDGVLKYYPMYGVSSNNDVQFRNLGGIVKITLPEMDSVITYIVIAADEAITGKYSFTSDCSSMSHVDAGNTDTSITIIANRSLGESEDVYVALPNGEYHNFSITMYTRGGYMARKVGSSVSVGRSEITTIEISNLTFARIDYEIPTLRVRAFNSFFVDKPIVFHYNYHENVVGADRIDDLQNNTPIWRKNNTNTVDVYTPAVEINAPSDCAGMFGNCSATSIDFGYGFNTSNVTNMSGMFGDCLGLTSLDLSTFNTSNVTNMRFMFSNSDLRTLDLSSFNTGNVVDMSGMFSECYGLTSLDLSSFNTSNDTNMIGMFEYCGSLTSLDLSSFNTSNVTDMYQMFYDCSSLTSLDLSSFNTGHVNRMDLMFEGCSRLSSLDISSFNTVNVTEMGEMFMDCRSLTSLDLSSFNISNVTHMDGMFCRCRALSNIEFSSSATIRTGADMSNMLGNLGTSASSGCTIHCNQNMMNTIINDSESGYNSTYVHFNNVY